MHFVNEEDFYLDESFGTGKDKRKRKSLQPKATGASLIHNLEKINEKLDKNEYDLAYKKMGRMDTYEIDEAFNLKNKMRKNSIQSHKFDLTGILDESFEYQDPENVDLRNITLNRAKSTELDNSLVDRYAIVKENVMKYDQTFQLARRKQFRQKEVLLSCSLSWDGNFAASTNYEGNLIVYNLNMVESIPDFKTEVMIGTVATAVKWLPQKSNDKELLVVTEKGTVHGFNTKTKKEILYYPEFEGQDCFLCLDIRADSKEYISGAKSGQIYCFDHVKSKIKKIFNQGEQLSIGHVNRVCSVRYLKTDLRTFISGACDKMIHIWDSRLSKPVHSILAAHVQSDTIDCKGFNILAGVKDDKDPLQMFDIRTLKKLDSLNWYQKGRGKRESARVYGARFFNNKSLASLIACSSSRDELRVFTQPDPALSYMNAYTIRNADKGIYCCDISANDDKIIFGTGDCYLHCLNVSY